MDQTLLIKLILMLAFFLEVVLFGKYVSRLQFFADNKIMSIAMTFSGTLFLSIALLDIIPQAMDGFEQFYKQSNPLQPSSPNHHIQHPPLTIIIACLTFMAIMYIDKILIGHTHDYVYDITTITQSMHSQRQIKDYQLKEILKQNFTDFNHGKNQNNNLKQLQQNNDKKFYLQNQKSKLASIQKQIPNKNNFRPFILQAGMSIHAFFECMAVGLQDTPISVLSLASAILVHKWAQGLTLGLIYRKEGYSETKSFLMIILQGVINVLGLMLGASLLGEGYFVMSFFMSISAGTFLYISLVQVLYEQISTMNQKKMITMVSANIFIALLVWLQRYTERIAQKN